MALCPLYVSPFNFYDCHSIGQPTKVPLPLLICLFNSVCINMKYNKAELIARTAELIAINELSLKNLLTINELSVQYLNAIPDTVHQIPSYDEFATYPEQEIDELLRTWAVDINTATELKTAWANHPSRGKLFASL